jgi:hypothetical protein
LDQIRVSEMAWKWSQLRLVHLGRRVPGSIADESYSVVEQISWEDTELMLGSAADVRPPAGPQSDSRPKSRRVIIRSATMGLLRTLPITGGCCCPGYVQCVRADRPITRRSGWPREKDLLTILAEKRMAPPRRESVQGKFDALATVAANLYQENIALKKKLGNGRRLASVPAQR